MLNTGYIKLFRSIIDSQVFANEKALKIWIWCLLEASHKKEYVPMSTGKGMTTVEVQPGQFIFGRHSAAKELRMKGTTVYDWMLKFASPKLAMITLKPDTHYTIVTICNWEQYQLEENDSCQATVKQPSGNPSSNRHIQEYKDTIKKKSYKKRKDPDEEILDQIESIPGGFSVPF